jgi:hypothetical protein
VAGIHRWEPIQYFNELADERLTLDTKQQVLKVVFREIGCPTGVGPELGCWNMPSFFVHTILD